MAFYAAWIAAPLVLILLSLGTGLLINRRKSDETNLVTVIASGFALISVIGALSVNLVATASLTTPLIALMAIIGFGIRFENLKRFAKDLSGLVVILITYLIAGLPIISLRKVSWPGWVQLDDTATFLAVTDHIMTKGYSVPQTLISTFDRTIGVVLGGAFYGTYNASTNTESFNYPVGSLVPLGITGQLSQVDYAWLYFPYLVFCIALVAGLAFVISRKFITNQIMAGAAAITIGMASTFYAYALWGGIKEVSLAPVILLSLLALQVISEEFLKPRAKRNRDRLNANYGFLALTLAGTYAMGGKSGIGFILGESVLFAILVYLRKNQQLLSKKFLIPAALFIIALGLLWKPISSFFNKYLIPEIPDSGNLSRPLNLLQLFGIWPSGDFRGDAYWQPYSYWGLALVALLTLLGIWRSLRGEIPFIAIGLLTTLTISIYSSIYNGIWLTGKAISVASPFFLLATFYGISQLLEWRRVKFLGHILLVSVILAVGTSNYLAYRYTWVAPSEKMEELQKIGKDFKGQGPTLMTEYAVLGARYFLRDLQAESVSELRVNVLPMRDGKEVPKGLSADIDLFDNAEVSRYNLLVLKHTATGSRPLFNYDLAYEGKYYDVWRKNQFGGAKIKSYASGNNYYPGAAISCPFILQSAATAGTDIYAAVRKPNYRISLSDGDLPKGWQVDKDNPGAVKPGESGSIKQTFKVATSGEYEWFIDGSYPGKMTILLDGKEVFAGEAFLEGNKYLNNFLFKNQLEAGEHSLEVKYSRPLTLVGAGIRESFGPIQLASEVAAKAEVLAVNPSNASSLCGKSLDWIAWEEK